MILQSWVSLLLQNHHFKHGVHADDVGDDALATGQGNLVTYHLILLLFFIILIILIHLKNFTNPDLLKHGELAEHAGDDALATDLDI